jgi:hypothetical protein
MGWALWRLRLRMMGISAEGEDYWDGMAMTAKVWSVVYNFCLLV